MCDVLSLPEYGVRSLAEVLPAALRALGLPEPPSGIELAPTRAVVLLLVDGLGADLLRAHAADAPFMSAMADAGPVTVGFPSSTPISLSSLGTGLPPGAHGMLGVSFRARPGELLDSILWKRQGSRDDRREELPPESVQAQPTVFERAAAAGIATTVASKREFDGSGLTRAALRGGEFRGAYTLGELVADIVDAVTRPGRQLCYGYVADLDGIGHARGPGSFAWRVQLQQVDRLVQQVVELSPPDVTVLVTGDHGMVFRDVLFDGDTDPALVDGVALLGGDPRARHVYALPGAAADVLAAWQARLGEHAWVVAGEQAVADGWFGPAVGASVRERVGDVVVALRGSAVVVRSEGEAMLARLPGQHGSLTPAEQLVPLLVREL
jgi:hypothetical protein